MTDDERAKLYALSNAAADAMILAGEKLRAGNFSEWETLSAKAVQFKELADKFAASLNSK